MKPRPSFSFNEIMTLIELMVTEKEIRNLSDVMTAEISRYNKWEWFEMRTRLHSRINELLK
jgi:hypothetical protein